MAVVRTEKLGPTNMDSPSLPTPLSHLIPYFRKTILSYSPCVAVRAPVLFSAKKIVAPGKAVNGSVRGWLESMRNLSPPRMRQMQVERLCNDKSERDAAEIKYRSWMVQHPSALDKFTMIIKAASEKRIAVFLDYDGTLSPIVENPDCAFMSEEMRTTVKEVASLFPTSIISGRSREKVYDFVQLPELYYAGSHGMDISGPAEASNGFKAHGTKDMDEKGNEVVLFQPASEFSHIMNEVFHFLKEKSSNIPGAKVEHNKFCISIHFRCVKEEDWIALADYVQLILNAHPNLQLTQGRKVLDIRPSIAWDKGKALEYLLKALSLGSRDDVFPIYIGDDRTDEDAFKVLMKWKAGLGILVSNTVKETNAACSLREPSEVLEFLRLLVKWRRHCLSRLV